MVMVKLFIQITAHIQEVLLIVSQRVSENLLSMKIVDQI